MNDNTITCPHCKQQFEISEALKHEIEEKVVQDERKKFEAKLREEVKKAEEQAKNKAIKTLEAEIKNSEEEIGLWIYAPYFNESLHGMFNASLK